MIKLLDKAALISIARYCDHPVAFLVGAPLSGDAGGGVPGVTPMLELVREEISKRAAPELPRYDAKIATCKSGGDAYQAAMEWLQGNVGQPAVNRVIEAAVLNWDFPYGFWPTTSVGLFHDFHPARPICKNFFRSFFQFAIGFLWHRGCFGAIRAFSHAFPPHAKTPLPWFPLV